MAPPPRAPCRDTAEFPRGLHLADRLATPKLKTIGISGRRVHASTRAATARRHERAPRETGSRKSRTMSVEETNASLQRVLDALTTNDLRPPRSDVTPPDEFATIDHLDAGLRDARLELWYQPKIDIKQRCLAGAEALARIRDPEKGVLLPADFLPGVSDDEVALLTVLRDWAVFDEGGFNLQLSINLPVHLLDRLPNETIATENRPAAEYWP